MTKLPLSGHWQGSIRRSIIELAASWLRRLPRGCLVRVPIGRRFVLGVVVETGATADVDYSKLKLVSQLCYDEPILNRELLELAEWIRNYYGSSRESVLETMIPASVRRGMSPKKVRFVSLGREASNEELERLEKRAPKQKALYDFLSQQIRPQNKGLILKRLDLSPATYSGLLEKGFVKEETRIEERTAYDDEIGSLEYVEEKSIELNDEQQVAVESLHKELAKGGFATHLLYGVTGSGKTEVYLQAMESALNRDQGVLYLVPEVALTPKPLDGFGLG